MEQKDIDKIKTAPMINDEKFNLVCNNIMHLMNEYNLTDMEKLFIAQTVLQTLLMKQQQKFASKSTQGMIKSMGLDKLMGGGSG